MTREKTQFLSAQFSVVAHATEDINKVEQAATFVVQMISKDEVNLSRQYVRGHHGNLITTISAKLASKTVAGEALRLLSQKLSESDKQFLGNEIRNCVDEDGNLYLRFDKQEAYLRKVRLHQADPIRMKLRFVPGYDVARIIEVCRESGLAS